MGSGGPGWARTLTLLAEQLIQKPSLRRRATQKKLAGDIDKHTKSNKNAQHFPSSGMKARCVSGIALWRRDFVSWFAQKREFRKRETKERGRRAWGNNVRVRSVGGDPCKGTPTQKGPLEQQCLGGPCDPDTNTKPKNRSRQGGDQPSALEGLPWESLLPGRARSPGPASARSRGGPSSVRSRKQDKRGKTKTTKENRRKRPCRLASEKGASVGASEFKPHEVSRESKNTKTRRAQNGTPRKHQKRRDARPKWAMTHMRRGQKKEKEQDQKGASVGCVL